MKSSLCGGVWAAWWIGLAGMAAYAQSPPDTARGDRMIAEYFAHETELLDDACLAEIKSAEDWAARRAEYRRQLFEMLGLDPLPPRTDLKLTVTNTVEHDEFIVDCLHYQSLPGLYVTANLYRPKAATERLPAVLYVCGHGREAKNNVSLGNKTHYQHHGAWFARNGYVCLTLDTLQLGEIEGIHHGTYRYNRWWWLNRGYTSAGVEAWNCIRALDYLETRADVDAARIGVTGRSGGGAYSWWIAALDDRIRCAVPVAGITNLRNHVVDGCVEGHCDCMYMVNTYRWDYAQVAALVAPRPLLISNTDSDNIFPLDGVYDIFERVRRVYTLLGARDKVALNITAGGHQDTQELQVHAFRWLNQHLKNDQGLVEREAVKFFEPEQLKVFAELPADEVNTKIDEQFVAAAQISSAAITPDKWPALRDEWRAWLLDRCFRAWPSDPPPLELKEAFRAEQDQVQLTAYDFDSQAAIRLRLFVVQRAGLARAKQTELIVLDAPAWTDLLAVLRSRFETQLAAEALPEADAAGFDELRNVLLAEDAATVFVAPRGIGPTAWDHSDRKQIQHQRRFYLLGQTLDGMRVWDVRRAIQAVRQLPTLAESPLWLQSDRAMAGVTLYASLFEPRIARLDLHELPATHRDGPFLLNVSRFLDLPQALALAMESSQVYVYGDREDDWQFARDAAKQLNWPGDRLTILPRELPASP